MKLLITGYPGWLVNRFIETRADYVTRFDLIRCLAHPSRTVLSPMFEGIEVVYGDLANLQQLELAAQNCDVVLHAAGVLHVRKIPEFYEVNREGTRRLLTACVANGVKKFVFISSNAAQGFCADPTKPLSESDLCRPSCDYGRSKYEAEQIVEEFHKSGKIQTTILRPAMFYGPPVAKRHLDIYKRILKGTFPVFGSGEYRRSVTFIDNLIQAIHLTLQQERFFGQTYTIIDREIPTLNEIIETIGRELGCKVKMVHYPAWMADWAERLDQMLARFGIYWMLPHIVGESNKHIAYRIDKAEQQLGYRPTVDYREGYRRTIGWCREQGLI